MIRIPVTQNAPVSFTTGTFTGMVTAGGLNVTGSTIPANGVYLPSGNNVGISSNSTLRLQINDTYIRGALGSPFQSLAASGSDAFQAVTAGARIHFSGASDYFSSDGTTITFAGPVTLASSVGLAVTASGSAGGTITGASGSLRIDNAVGSKLSYNAGYLSVDGAGNAGMSLSNTANTATLIGAANVNVTAVGNAADTTEDTLMTYSLPASTMTTSGKGVRVTCWGSGVSTADVTTVKCYFGATVVLTRILTASQANTWRAVFEVLRTGATAQIATGAFVNGGAVVTTVQSNTSPAETLSGAVTIKCTGQRATTSTANSVQQLGMIVEFFN